MTSDDVHDDPVLTALRQLPTQDVDRRRAHRLHVRCRAALAAGNRAADGAARVDSARWRLTAGPALLAAWCLIYVIEIVRFAVAIHGL
jgi:hypothetical protein